MIFIPEPPLCFGLQFIQAINFKYMLIIPIIVGCHQTPSKNGGVLAALWI